MARNEKLRTAESPQEGGSSGTEILFSGQLRLAMAGCSVCARTALYARARVKTAPRILTTIAVKPRIAAMGLPSCVLVSLTKYTSKLVARHWAASVVK